MDLLCVILFSGATILPMSAEPQQVRSQVAAPAVSVGGVPAPKQVVVTDDDDEYEEIIIRRKKKTKPVAKPVAPTVVPPVVQPGVSPLPVLGDVQPQPISKAKKKRSLEPTVEDAADPRKLVHYFCKTWKNEDWERLWWTMDAGYRKAVPLKKFRQIFKDDAESNGGLLDETIISVAKTGTGEAVKVELAFKFPRAKHRFVIAEVRRLPNGSYRIYKSSIVPIDFSDL